MNENGNGSVNANANEIELAPVHLTLEDLLRAIRLLRTTQTTVVPQTCHTATYPPARLLNQLLLVASGASPMTLPLPTTRSANGSARGSTNSNGNARCDGELLRGPVEVPTCSLPSTDAHSVATCAMLSAVQSRECPASPIKVLASPTPPPYLHDAVQPQVFRIALELSALESANKAQMCRSPPWALRAHLATLLIPAVLTTTQGQDQCLQVTPAACSHPLADRLNVCVHPSLTALTMDPCPSANSCSAKGIVNENAK